MVVRTLTTQCVISLFACLLVGKATATTGSVDRHSFDIHAACDSAPQTNRSVEEDRKRAVFTVLVTDDDGHLQPNGTATLVDDDGTFLTAAHVVLSRENRALEVRRKLGNDVKEYSVHAITTTKDWLSEDLVLLKADSWNKPPIAPVPFHLYDLEYIDGSYIGHAEDMEEVVYGPLTQEFSETPNSEMKYEGKIFPHASGALLLDRSGRAFALVLRQKDISGMSAGGLQVEQLYRILYERDQFWALPLSAALDKIKSLRPSDKADSMMKELAKNGVDNDWLLNLKGNEITPVDMIHLIDAVFSDGAWSKITQPMRVQLLTLCPKLLLYCAQICTS